MKKIIFSNLYFWSFTIFLSMTSLMMLSSCEQNETHATGLQTDESPILPRTVEDCDDCPEEYCCCVVENLMNFPVDQLFCGVYTMTAGSACGPVSPGSPCGTISGTSYLISMDAFGNGFFCVEDSASFSILNLSASANLRITCKANEVNPPWVGFTIDSSPVYYNVEDCNLEGC